jgi:large subunit ribosomal protein L1
MAKSGKKYLAAAAKIERLKAYPVADAIALAKEVSFTKFDETMEVAFRLINKSVVQWSFLMELAVHNVY